MKTIEQLRAKIAAMPRKDLDQFAENVVLSLYGVLTPGSEEIIQIDEGNEWRIDTLESVAEDIDDANLSPQKL